MMNKLYKLLKCIFVFTTGFSFSIIVEANELSPEALYHRCYAQLTQKRLKLNDELLDKVIKRQVSPIAACLSLLEKAYLRANGVIANTNDELAKTILNNFHRLHTSWFKAKDFPPNFSGSNNFSVQRIYDNTAPALYYTKALFDPTISFNYVLKANKNLVPVRTSNDVSQFGTTKKTDFVFNQSQFLFASQGELLGAIETDIRNWSYNYTQQTNNASFSGSVATGLHIGGGILGSPSYLLTVVDEDTNFKADGAVQMPRKWARDFINDLMCRELPLVRPGDADFLVVTSSQVEFRKSKDCNRCHATMDRMASTLRNIQFISVAGSTIFTPRFGGAFPKLLDTNQPAEKGWPAIKDNNYANRPTKGTLFFRNYKGDLINQEVNSVADLALKLSEHEDIYICAASRYYEYFTGIKTQIGDIGDSSLGYDLTEADLLHRNTVIALGKKLKEHNNTRQLIEDIFNLPQYKAIDLSVSNSRGLAGE